jgi:RNA polymerase sigma factor (sigma-70 family)
VVGIAELSKMEPLTDAERSLVDTAMRLLPRTLGERRFSAFVPALGYDRCHDAATSAYMRAAKAWNPELAPFHIYAAIWLRKYLILSLAEAASRGDVEVPESLQCDRPQPDKLAENAELINAAFRVLPARQREVLMLRSAGLTWPEVAAEMRCCLTLVRRYHVRAMVRLWKFTPQLRSSSYG